MSYAEHGLTRTGVLRSHAQMMQRSASEMMDSATVRAVSGLLRNFSANLPDTLLAGLPGHLLAQQHRAPSVPQTARAWRPGDASTPFSKIDPEP